MSGFDWVREDRETAGEGVARCRQRDCQAPMLLVIGPTLVVERCSVGHVVHVQLAYAEGWWYEA